jgi:hypothetical protein
MVICLVANKLANGLVRFGLGGQCRSLAERADEVVGLRRDRTGGIHDWNSRVCPVVRHGGRQSTSAWDALVRVQVRLTRRVVTSSSQTATVVYGVLGAGATHPHMRVAEAL